MHLPDLFEQLLFRFLLWGTQNSCLAHHKRGSFPKFQTALKFDCS